MRRLSRREREARARAVRPIRVLRIERVTIRAGGAAVSVPRVRFLERQVCEIREAGRE